MGQMEAAAAERNILVFILGKGMMIGDDKEY